jgi:eukaryotic-like serine/threonine-protein kinase
LVWARSADLRTFVLGPGTDSVRLWDAPSKKYFGPPLTHLGVIRVAAFSPDGKLVVTASDDETARVWDVATGKAVGPPLPHRINQILFSSDGVRILIGQGSQALLLDTPAPLAGDPERILLWVQSLTATQLDDAEGGVSELNTAAWESIRRRLEEMGGPPMP